MKILVQAAERLCNINPDVRANLKGPTHLIDRWPMPEAGLAEISVETVLSLIRGFYGIAKG